LFFFYKKNAAYSHSDFFDRISCEALEHLKLDVDGEVSGPNAKQVLAEQRKVDSETFGVAAVRSMNQNGPSGPHHRGGASQHRGGHGGPPGGQRVGPGANSTNWRNPHHHQQGQNNYQGGGGGGHRNYNNQNRSYNNSNYQGGGSSYRGGRGGYHRGGSTQSQQRTGGQQQQQQQQGQYRPAQQRR